MHTTFSTNDTSHVQLEYIQPSLQTTPVMCNYWGIHTSYNLLCTRHQSCAISIHTTFPRHDTSHAQLAYIQPSLHTPEATFWYVGTWPHGSMVWTFSIIKQFLFHYLFFSKKRNDKSIFLLKVQRFFQCSEVRTITFLETIYILFRFLRFVKAIFWFLPLTPCFYIIQPEPCINPVLWIRIRMYPDLHGSGTFAWIRIRNYTSGSGSSKKWKSM